MRISADVSNVDSLFVMHILSHTPLASLVAGTMSKQAVLSALVQRIIIEFLTNENVKLTGMLRRLCKQCLHSIRRSLVDVTTCKTLQAPRLTSRQTIFEQFETLLKVTGG